jgi:hypothetical protein
VPLPSRRRYWRIVSVVVVEFIGAIGGGGGVVVVCSVVVVVWETGGGDGEHPARRTVPAISATPRARPKGDVVTIIVWLQKSRFEWFSPIPLQLPLVVSIAAAATAATAVINAKRVLVSTMPPE